MTVVPSECALEVQAKMLNKMLGLCGKVSKSLSKSKPFHLHVTELCPAECVRFRAMQFRITIWVSSTSSLWRWIVTMSKSRDASSGLRRDWWLQST